MSSEGGRTLESALFARGRILSTSFKLMFQIPAKPKDWSFRKYHRSKIGKVPLHHPQKERQRV